MNWAIPCAPAGGHVPAPRRAQDRLPEARRHKRRQAARPGSLAVAAPADRVSRLRARGRTPGEAEVPRLPGVALQEAEPPRVAGQPPVGAGGTEVELGGAAVQ